MIDMILGGVAVTLLGVAIMEALVMASDEKGEKK